jgi:hypothetical protein
MRNRIQPFSEIDTEGHIHSYCLFGKFYKRHPSACSNFQTK